MMQLWPSILWGFACLALVAIGYEGFGVKPELNSNWVAAIGSVAAVAGAAAIAVWQKAEERLDKERNLLARRIGAYRSLMTILSGYRLMSKTEDLSDFAEESLFRRGHQIVYEKLNVIDLNYLEDPGLHRTLFDVVRTLMLDKPRFDYTFKLNDLDHARKMAEGAAEWYENLIDQYWERLEQIHTHSALSRALS